MIKIPTMAQATPIPAFAPGESPLCGVDVDDAVSVESGGLPGARLVDVGLKPLAHVIDPPTLDGTV